MKIRSYESGSQNTGTLRGGKLQQVHMPDTGAALSDVGRSFGQVAQGIAREEQIAQAAFKKAADSRTLNNEVAGATRGISVFTQDLQSDPDGFEFWEEKHEEYVNKTVEDARNRLPANVFDSWNASFQKIATKSYIDIRGAARTILVDKGKADLNSNLSVYNNIYATQPDPEDRRVTLGQAYLSISDAQNNGFITEVEANVKRESFVQSVETTRLENDLLNNPEATQEKFDAGEYAVTEESKPAYKKRIDAAVEAEKKERNTQIEKNEKKQEKALKQAQNDLEIDFREKLSNGELTEKDVFAAGQRRKLRPDQVESLVDDLNKGESDKSDPVEYTNVLEGIIGRTIINPTEITNNRLLSPGDKKMFTGMLDKKQGEIEKDIISAMKPFIISTGPMAQFVKQDEQILMQSAVEEMKSRLGAGEDPEELKTDLIKRYGKVFTTMNQLPKLRFGHPDNLDLAKSLLVQKFKEGKISQTEAERQAELIQDYEEAMANQKAFEALAKKGGGKRK